MGLFQEFFDTLFQPGRPPVATEKPSEAQQPPPPYEARNHDIPRNGIQMSVLTRYRPRNGDYDALFHFQSGTDAETVVWDALLKVKAPAGVAKLMVDGFHLDERNLDRKSGVVIWPEKGDFPIKFRDSVARRYRLHDKKDEAGSWKAELHVFSGQLSTLSRFRISELGREKCVFVTAWQRDGAVYHYSAERPGNNFNALYDDMPLAGLWPWPRRNSEGCPVVGESDKED